MNFLIRFGAVSGVICGLLTGAPGAVEAFTGETKATSFFIAFGAAFGLPLLTALHLGQQHAVGRFGRAAYAVNLIGLALFACAGFTLNMVFFYLPEQTVTDLLEGPTRFGFLIGLLVFVAGTIMFSVSMGRAKVYPAVPAWGYGVALTIFALAARFPDSPLTSGLHVIVGGILIWLSLAVGQTPATRFETPGLPGLVREAHRS